MKLEKGLFIAIEGSDGCGKNTQTDLLTDKLEQHHNEVMRLTFPQYQKDSSFFVREYLAGEYGSIDEISEKEASLFFALDRYDAKADINKALGNDQIVVTDRFVASNLAHQGAKIFSNDHRLEFFKWIDDLEFNILNIPRPDLNIILDVPADISQDLMADRNKVQQTKPDIHEQDIRQQEVSRQIYGELCDLFPDNFTYINCLNEHNKLASPEDIHQKIMQNLGRFVLKQNTQKY